MKRPYQYQPKEQAVIRARIASKGLTQNQIARELNRSQGAIARALRGERNTLLGRIVNLLDRKDRHGKSKPGDNEQKAA